MQQMQEIRSVQWGCDGKDRGNSLREELMSRCQSLIGVCKHDVEDCVPWFGAQTILEWAHAVWQFYAELGWTENLIGTLP